MNKNVGEFTTDDLELLNLAARMLAAAIDKSGRYADTEV
jgi:hypothetical protein